MNSASDLHVKLLGRAPSPAQRTLYEAFDNVDVRGFTYIEQDVDVAVATVVLALRQAKSSNDSPTEPVLILVPRPHEAWLLDQIRILAREVFRGARGHSEASIRARRDVFKALRIGRRIFGTLEPPKWVAYGFKPNDTLPAWMKGRILEP